MAHLLRTQDPLVRISKGAVLGEHLDCDCTNLKSTRSLRLESAAICGIYSEPWHMEFSKDGNARQFFSDIHLGLSTFYDH